MTYDRRAAEPVHETEDVGELEVAEWIILLLAYDTYFRTFKEKTGIKDPVDPVIQKGVGLLRTIGNQHGDSFHAFLAEHMPTPSLKTMLAKAFRLGATRQGLPRQALQIRMVLSRGGTGVVRKVFKTNRAIQEVKTAISASQFDDGAAALDKFGVLSVRNGRIRAWIDLAAKTAGAGSFQNAVDVANVAVEDEAKDLALDRAKKVDAPLVSEETHVAAQEHTDRLVTIQQTATEAAKKALDISGEPDVPPTKSEVIGIATAAAAAATVAVDDTNIPETLKKLDPEQRDAALTNGKVLVAAGAGAGKSTTLVARVSHLVKNSNVSPSRILACSFNTKAADELKQKLAKALGPETGSRVIVGTMNSLFNSFIVGNPKTGFAGFGTLEEKGMLTGNRLISDNRSSGGPQQRAESDDEIRGKKPTPLNMSVAIRGIWSGCSPEVLAAHLHVDQKLFEEGPPKAKQMNTYLSKWQGNDVSLEQARSTATRPDEIKASFWYELYLGLKGDLGRAWRPPCGTETKPFQKFMGDFRKGGERLGDMNDQIKILRDILKRDPSARKALQDKFDHLLVDECQDLNSVQHEVFDYMSEHIDCHDKNRSIWMVGDDKQCPSSMTPIQTPKGDVLAKDLRTGDEVFAWRNGQLKAQTVTVSKSTWNCGFKISTESGKVLTVSPNHKMWATAPELQPHQVATYLMFRSDLGFRVGITSKGQKGAGYLGSLAGRAFQEKAEKMWVLSVHDDREAAKFEETSISLRYGIPTLVFNGVHRGLNQDRINATFDSFGKNGAKLLEDQHLELDLPHWISKGYAKHGRDRRVVQLLAHAPKFSLVRFEWSRNAQGENPLTEALKEYSYEETGRDRFRLRKSFANYREAQTFAVGLARKADALLNHTLSTPEGALQKVTASIILPGMRVPVLDGETLLLEEVVHVSKVEDLEFINLEVNDASNFFGGGILSSNSIYQFRGAKPEKFTALHKDPCWQTKMIRTNYRCEPEIVETANRLIANNPDQIPMEARGNPAKTRGEASIVLDMPDSNATAAITTIGRVRKDMDQASARPEDYAVLSRTNNELNDFETACIINEIPYVRRGGKGFLDAPESKAILSYMDLAGGTDYEKKQESLCHALLHPDHGVFMGPGDCEKAVKSALDDVARRERVPITGVDPTELLRNRQYARILADNLKRKYKIAIVNSMKGNISKGEWLYNKVVDELTEEVMDMGRQVNGVSDILVNPEAKTTDLFEYILDNVKGTKKFWDKDKRQQVTESQSLREHISDRMALFDEDEEQVDDTEEEKPEIGEGGVPTVAPVTDKPEEGKGLGAVQFLYALMTPNKNDQDSATDPEKAEGFQKKLTRYAEIAKKLRIDPKKWAAEQRNITDPKLRQEKPPAITLSTIHSVKGMEWPNVTVMIPKGKFPMERKPKPGEPPPDPEEQAKELKAERNLAYVAVTRAAKNLEIHAIPDPKRKPGTPPTFSIFVNELALKPGENVPKEGPTLGSSPPPVDDSTKIASELANDEELMALVASYAEPPKVAAVLDERGFEVIGHYSYGRTGYDRSKS
jgi:superfamily I DNA/RNA helicase